MSLKEKFLRMVWPFACDPTKVNAISGIHDDLGVIVQCVAKQTAAAPELPVEMTENLLHLLELCHVAKLAYQGDDHRWITGRKAADVALRISRDDEAEKNEE